MSRQILKNKLRPVVCGLAAASLVGCAGITGKGQETQDERQQAAKVTRQESKATATGERKVKGRGGWEGYISGEPWKGAKFSRLEVGMSYRQVLDLIGPPTDQYSHVTGKAWIPFYFGSGRYEHKLLYKGQGRLVFAGDAGFSSNAHLIGIEFNRNESGYH